MSCRHRGSGGRTPRTQSPHGKRLNVRHHDPVAVPGEGTLVPRDGSRNKCKEPTIVTLEWGGLTLWSIAMEHVAQVLRTYQNHLHVLLMSVNIHAKDGDV